MREFTYLNTMGMIKFVPGCDGFDAMPRPPQKINEIFNYLRITPLGHEYLTLARAVTGEVQGIIGSSSTAADQDTG
jgi:hypothetical protein